MPSMKMNSKLKKKSQIKVLLAISFALIVFYIVFVSWNYLFGKTTSGFGQSVEGITQDKDLDGIANAVDDCPCPPGGKGVLENKGCPSSYKIKGDGTGLEDRSCLTKTT